jgi:hypothetical protein
VREMVERSASHRPEPDDDDVGGVCHGEGECTDGHAASIPAVHHLKGPGGHEALAA